MLGKRERTSHIEAALPGKLKSGSDLDIIARGGATYRWALPY